MAFCGAACGVLPFINQKLDGGEYKEAPHGKLGSMGMVGDGSVDLRGRPVSKADTGGWKTASLVFGAVAFESVASVGVAFTLFSYLTGPMHVSVSKASIHTNIYWGTSFITSLFGGFVSDAYLGRFRTSLISAITELLGLSLMVVSVRVEGLRPDCAAADHGCPSFEYSGGFIAFVFALYMVALGGGCLRPCLATLGADQFDIEDVEERRQVRSYFNWFFFAMSAGSMVAMSAVVYVAESVSWFWSFTMMGAAMLLSTACLVAGAGRYRHKTPQGSPLTRVAQVVVAAARKKRTPAPVDSSSLFEVQDHETGTVAAPTEPTLKRFNSNKGEVLGEPTLKRYYSLPHTNGFGFLDKAAVVTEQETGATTVNPWSLCTITQVEELKTMLRCCPIIFIVSFLYIVVAQIQTWAVAEGYTMARTFGKFAFPPPSMSAISVAIVLVEVVLYDRWFVPFARRFTNHPHGITHLQRIGVGLVQSILAMAYGAIVETARLRAARRLDAPLSIFWLLPMWVLASSAELFTYVGLLEFFWQEMPVEMRGLGAGLSLFTISLGYYQSGGFIIITNAVSKAHNGGWVNDPDLNKNQLNYFYLILMVCSALNAFGFVMTTKWYNYVKFIHNKTLVPPPPQSTVDIVKTGTDVPDYLARSESRTPLRSTNTSDVVASPAPPPPPRSPRINFFAQVFSPRLDADAAAPDASSPRFVKLDRSRSRPGS